MLARVNQHFAGKKPPARGRAITPHMGDKGHGQCRPRRCRNNPTHKRAVGEGQLEPTATRPLARNRFCPQPLLNAPLPPVVSQSAQSISVANASFASALASSVHGPSIQSVGEPTPPPTHLRSNALPARANRACQPQSNYPAMRSRLPPLAPRVVAFPSPRSRALPPSEPKPVLPRCALILLSKMAVFSLNLGIMIAVALP